MRRNRLSRRIALLGCTLAVAGLGVAGAANHANPAKPSAAVLRSSDATPRMLRVNNQSPTATIYPSVSNFRVDAMVDTYDPDGHVVSMVIDFGDGATSTHSGASASASHTYAAAGTYTITVTAVDNAGGYGVGTYTIWVSGGDTT